jgi:hypothetical protein
MNKINLTVSALALAFACSAGALAQGVSKDEYKAGKQRIAADYTAAKTACGSLSGNAKDICIAEAKGKEHVARAELLASYKPGLKSSNKVRIATAQANYAVAKQRCDDLAGNVKDVCVKEAAAARTTALADAELQLKTVQANRTATEKTKDARSQADSKTMDARNDAAAQKREAQYKVEKEKCDALASGAKDNCLTQAKTSFGKV